MKAKKKPVGEGMDFERFFEVFPLIVARNRPLRLVDGGYRIADNIDDEIAAFCPELLAAVGIRVDLAEKAAERGPKRGRRRPLGLFAKGEKRIQNGGLSVSVSSV